MTSEHLLKLQSQSLKLLAHNHSWWQSQVGIERTAKQGLVRNSPELLFALSSLTLVHALTRRLHLLTLLEVPGCAGAACVSSTWLVTPVNNGASW